MFEATRPLKIKYFDSVLVCWMGNNEQGDLTWEIIILHVRSFKYSQPSLYRHSIKRQNFYNDILTCTKPALKQKCRQNIVFSTSSDSNKYKKDMVYEVIKIKKRHFLHTILLIKDALQQQIHFNYIFGNKFCRCNKGSFYKGFPVY